MLFIHLNDDKQTKMNRTERKKINSIEIRIWIITKNCLNFNIFFCVCFSEHFIWDKLIVQFPWFIKWFLPNTALCMANVCLILKNANAQTFDFMRDLISNRKLTVWIKLNFMLCFGNCSHTKWLLGLRGMRHWWHVTLLNRVRRWHSHLWWWNIQLTMLFFHHWQTNCKTNQMNQHFEYLVKHIRNCDIYGKFQMT